MKRSVRTPLREDRKLAQLCAQVEDVCGLALGDAADDRLRELVVHSVIPGPDGSRLLVLVAPIRPIDVDRLEELYDALETARSWLRREIAGGIHRKRTPEVAFQVLPHWPEDS